VPIRDGLAFVLRNRTLPLLRLADLLALPAPSADGDITILVATVNGNRIGIEVDRFDTRMDVVLRPLAGLLSGMNGILGTSLLGDGHVLLVLNLAELVE
jgi:two-component system chemotaxis sensor kinase CheA